MISRSPSGFFIVHCLQPDLYQKKSRILFTSLRFMLLPKGKQLRIDYITLNNSPTEQHE